MYNKKIFFDKPIEEHQSRQSLFDRAKYQFNIKDDKKK
jgi:hypothetical protein